MLLGWKYSWDEATRSDFVSLLRMVAPLAIHARVARMIQARMITRVISMTRPVLAAVAFPLGLHCLLELIELIGAHHAFEPFAGLFPDFLDLRTGLLPNTHQLFASIGKDLFDLGPLILSKVETIHGLFQVVHMGPAAARR